MIVLKTETISAGDGDDPTHVICKGHVDIEKFNKAHLAEGWDNAGFQTTDLYYTYATFIDGVWTWGLKITDKDVRPVTVCKWD